MFTIAEKIGHKSKDCQCSLCMGVPKLAPDYDECFPEQERRDAAKQFEHDEKLQTLGDD